MKKEDDIFKKLNKEKPLVKRISPSQPERRRIAEKQSESELLFTPMRGEATSERQPQISRRIVVRPEGGPPAADTQPERARNSRRIDIDAPAPQREGQSDRPSERELSETVFERADARKDAASANDPEQRQLAEGSDRQNRRGYMETMRIEPKAAAKVARAQPEQRKQVASDYAQGKGGEPAIVIDDNRRHKPLPTAEFGSQRVHKPVPESQKTADDEGRPVDKASFASDRTMQFRHELKYYINYRDYIVLRQCLKALLTPDESGDENNSYHVRSIYFDDFDESSLVEKMAGVQNRNKYRIRFYNFNDRLIRFEKKMKRGQYLAKKSITLVRSEVQDLLDGNPDFLLSRKESFAKELYLEFRHRQLKPRVVVDYMREAYVLPYEDVRITFDKDLKSGKPFGNVYDKNLPVVPIADPETMILEVKFNRYLPDYVKKVLNNLTAPERLAISKYTNCRKYE